jgi:hypothetical protein
MMKIVVRMVIGIGILAMSVTLAQAGGGQGGGGAELAGFQCYVINGVNQHRVANTTDATDPAGTSIKFPDRTNVRIGDGRLICAPVQVTLVGSVLDDTTNYPFAEHLKCYDAFDPRLLVVRGPQVTTWDPLDVEDLRVGAPVFLCIGAAVTPPRPPEP